MGYLKTLKEAEGLIAQRAPFTTGTLSGHLTSATTYEVASYGTVIAIDFWPATPAKSDFYLNETKYSNTTSKHLNIVKRAWGVN